MKKKFLVISLGVLVLGIVFLILENTFYQYVDSKGFLHESLFLPIGTLCICLGAIGLVAYIIKYLFSSLIANR